MDAASVVLASASPRRRRLIGWLGVEARITSAETDEDLSLPLRPANLVCALAADKALAVEAGSNEIVLAFDTVVVHDGHVLGKPTDRADARRMLEALSGGTHEVVTGVAIRAPGTEEVRVFPVTTAVTMRQVPAEALEAWLAGDEVLGCAGAYNIERHLASVADDECYHNVAGMPLCHVYAELASSAVATHPAGITPPVTACDAALGRRCGLGPSVCERSR